MRGCGDMKVDLPYLMRDVDRHGNQRIYLRKSGRKTRIHAREGTAEFFQEYYQALEKTSKKVYTAGKSGGFRWLCSAYFASPEFQGLATSTRKARRAILESICQANGDKPYALMQRRHVLALRDEKAEFPEAANGRVKALRAMYGWAVDRGLAEDNPTTGVKRLKVKSDGFAPWTLEECERYEKRWPTGTRQRLAYTLLRYLGVRRSDAVTLGRQHIKSGTVTFKIKKTGRSLSLPLPLDLAAQLSSIPTDLTFLRTEYGKPFSDAGFGLRFAEWCKEAGVSKRAHGLRKTRAIELAENGATVNELMAYFGWETPQEAIRYTRMAQQKVLAQGAARRKVE